MWKKKQRDRYGSFVGKQRTILIKSTWIFIKRNTSLHHQLSPPKPTLYTHIICSLSLARKLKENFTKTRKIQVLIVQYIICNYILTFVCTILLLIFSVWNKSFSFHNWSKNVILQQDAYCQLEILELHMFRLWDITCIT